MSQAGAISFSGGGGGGGSVLTLTPDTGGAISPDVSGNINLLGGEGIVTDGVGNTITISGTDATAGTSLTAVKGIASFDDTMFIVTNGFVQLMSGPTGISSITVDAFTPPGTNPVVPDGTGFITITGGQIAPASTTNAIRTDSIAANSIRVEIQRSSSAASTNVGLNGISHFNSAQFTIDSNGFVSATGTIPIQFTGNTGTAAPAAGNINLLGTGSITTTASGSTVTTALTGLTNHAVLVGAGTATITKVGPTATAGQILQSAGAAADPAFSTATYPSTTTISQLLYSSATNVVSGLATANNGTLVTNNTGVPSILAGPGTTGNILQSNAAAAPSFSTATYPSTTTINQILYSSSNNVVAGVTAANQSVLTSTTTGVPAWVSMATDGKVLIGSTAGNPAAATLTAGTGVTITNASNSITINAAAATPLSFPTDSGTATPAANALTLAGSGSITTTGSGATVTTALTGLTNHNVLIGAGTSTITKVAPSATSGVPLISQGASADPVFGTALVAGGGTGNTTFTAYSVITAGTTATGAFQNVSGVGNSGQVLTSNGAAALPTWQAAGTGSAFTSVVVQWFNADGTYTPTAGMKYCIVEVVGGGGGGGGAVTTGAGQVSAGGGGGGGGYNFDVISAATIGASKAVTIGTAGTAGASTGGNGGTGGTTSLGALLTATGGGGGIGSGAAAVSSSSNGGNAGSGVSPVGSLLLLGNAGHGGIGTFAGGFVIGGAGGSTYFGSGGKGSQAVTAGQSGTNPGACGGGGGGSCNFASTAGRAGGAGGVGIVRITEFI